LDIMLLVERRHNDADEGFLIGAHSNCVPVGGWMPSVPSLQPGAPMIWRRCVIDLRTDRGRHAMRSTTKQRLTRGDIPSFGQPTAQRAYQNGTVPPKSLSLFHRC